MKIVIAAAVALALSVLNTFATSQDDAFQKVAHDYVEQYLKVNPEQATELGDHRFDGEVTDYSVEARAKDLATQKEFRDKLNAIDGSQLTSANNVDFRILKENIDYEIFRAEELKEPEWNPLIYMRKRGDLRGPSNSRIQFWRRVAILADAKDRSICCAKETVSHV